MSWKVVLAVIFLILLSVFAMQNYEVVTVKFFTFNFQTSIAIMTFSTALAGVLIGIIAAVAGRRRPAREGDDSADF